MKIRPILFFIAFTALFCTGCSEYDKLGRNIPADQYYEYAKQWYAEGLYNQAAQTLGESVAMLKGTEKGEESLFLLCMSSYYARNYDAAASYFKRYYTVYPNGIFTEKAHYYAGMALALGAPEIKLDQTSTLEAVTEFQNYLELYPAGSMSEEVQRKIFELQDRLVEKEYLSAKLYYDLGSYFGNCSGGGSNYQACIITAENAIKDFPYTSRREDLAMLILQAKFDLAKESVEKKKVERYHAAIDEYYGFTGEFPESKYLAQAEALFKQAKKFVDKREGKSPTEAQENKTQD